jgi:hypothetical protein
VWVPIYIGPKRVQRYDQGNRLIVKSWSSRLLLLIWYQTRISVIVNRLSRARRDSPRAKLYVNMAIAMQFTSSESILLQMLNPKKKN